MVSRVRRDVWVVDLNADEADNTDERGYLPRLFFLLQLVLILLLRPIWAMPAATVTAVTALQMVLFSKHQQARALIYIVVLAFF